MKKGFTLIELLAVIIILAIILVIAVPGISRIVESAKLGALEDQVKLVQRAAVLKYGMDSRWDCSTVNKSNIKQELDIDGSTFDEVGIELNDDKITTTIIKDGITVTSSNNLVVNNTKVYGLSWNITDGKFTRTDDAKSLLTVQVGVGNEKVTNNFDTAEIYSEMVEVTDEYGNQFIKIPKFYIKKTVTDTAWTWQISKKQKDTDYYLPACFVDEGTGQIFSYVLVGKYNASLDTSTSKLESKSGKNPLVSKNITEFRAYAQANNDLDSNILGYQILDVHVVDILQTLFYIEFATLDSQSIMKGNTSNDKPLASGTTDDVTAKSGSLISNSDGKYAMKYRGIENFYGNLWQFVDGINIKADNQAYVSRNATAYDSYTYAGDYVKVGYVNANTNGYVLTMGYDKNHPFIQLPTTVGSGQYKDYYYQASGNRIALFGGRWSDGTAAGASYWTFYNGATITALSFGSRLLKTPF